MGRSTGLSVLRRWGPVIAVFALVVAALIAAGLAEPQIDTLPPEDDPAMEPVQNPSGPSAIPSDPFDWRERLAERGGYEIPAWLDTVFGFFCTGFLLVLLAIAAWHVIRAALNPRGRRLTVDEGDPNRPAPADGVTDAVDAALAGLGDLDVDPRRAVIACWLRLEAAAAAAGTARQPADTATDLVLRLLSGHQVSRGPLEEFAGVYRAARYGTAPVDEAMRATAIAALTRVRTELAVNA